MKNVFVLFSIGCLIALTVAQNLREFHFQQYKHFINLNVTADPESCYNVGKCVGATVVGAGYAEVKLYQCHFPHLIYHMLF